MNPALPGELSEAALLGAVHAPSHGSPGNIWDGRSPARRHTNPSPISQPPARKLALWRVQRCSSPTPAMGGPLMISFRAT